MLILRRSDILALLDGREDELTAVVAEAYRLHHEGRTALPHSVFLRFPEQPADRIIGLPAYLGGTQPAAGMKWIASFPGNLAAGKERASAVVVLNSASDGRPEALLEGSVISARRTAASAALAAGLLLPDPAAAVGVSLVGCGVINGEVLRFLRARLPSLREVVVFDRDPQRAARFATAWGDGALRISVAEHLEDALGAHDLVSFATTSAEPYTTLDACRPEATVLHVSLRDLTPQALLESVNVVDDADHLCRERTSAHLAEQLSGGREFIGPSIGSLVGADGRYPRPRGRRVVFSPFGLGVLDLAVAGWSVTEARRKGVGLSVDGFLD